MEYYIDDFQQELVKTANRIGKEKIRPVAAELDVSGEFPWDIVKVFADSGFYGLWVPEEYGGVSRGIMDLVLVTEELSKFCGGISLAVAASALGTFPIVISGNDKQKEKYLPMLAAGEGLAAFGLTEPAAGSDAGSIQTRAIKKGDKYVLNGSKVFITNGGVAEVYTIIASTDPDKGTRGASAFIVEKGTPGFSFGKKEDKMGIRASVTMELIFEDCEIPEENRIGREGEGFSVAMKTLDKSRPGVAAQALGIGAGALDLATQYAAQREQFGQSIIRFQAIQTMLADMATKVESARAMLYATSRMIDGGTKSYSKESAMCKVWAADVAMDVTTDAVQIFGGYGYMRDYPVEKMMRDAKITQIYEGTNQIQRMVIARHLIKEAQRAS
jgi:alkylation response protein AidB-like acyl-CoA dehydrogenase